MIYMRTVKRGRPLGGIVRISMEDIDALPERLTCGIVARNLGYDRATIAGWIRSGAIPGARGRGKNNPYYFTKADLIKFMVATDRVLRNPTVVIDPGVRR